MGDYLSKVKGQDQREALGMDSETPSAAGPQDEEPKRSAEGFTLPEAERREPEPDPEPRNARADQPPQHQYGQDEIERARRLGEYEARERMAQEYQQQQASMAQQRQRLQRLNIDKKRFFEDEDYAIEAIEAARHAGAQDALHELQPVLGPALQRLESVERDSQSIRRLSERSAIKEARERFEREGYDVEEFDRSLDDLRNAAQNHPDLLQDSAKIRHMYLIHRDQQGLPLAPSQPSRGIPSAPTSAGGSVPHRNSGVADDDRELKSQLKETFPWMPEMARKLDLGPEGFKFEDSSEVRELLSQSSAGR